VEVVHGLAVPASAAALAGGAGLGGRGAPLMPHAITATAAATDSSATQLLPRTA
jgi:hypothetical protein